MLSTRIGATKFTVDTARPVDLSIPLDFNGPQANAFEAPAATASAWRSETFVGDTREGGSCNVEIYSLNAHCNGTHTECVGHIAVDRIAVANILKESLFPATVVTVTPWRAEELPDDYNPSRKPEDLLISKDMLEQQLTDVEIGFLDAVVVRTQPNGIEKKSRRYLDPPPAYFSFEAMKYIVDRGVNHLLVDLPSVDRLLDDGRMSAHRIFWGVAEGSHEVEAGRFSLRTITEMVYVPDEVDDGRYLLNLQIPSFLADAAPSRPVLYGLIQED